MKNIMLIIPYGSVGGMERLAYNFYTYYKENGFNVKVIKLIQLKSDIINFGADEIPMSTKDFSDMKFVVRLIFYLKMPYLIRKEIKKHNIVHSISFGDMCNVFSSLTFTEEHKVASIHALKSVEFIFKSFLNTIFKLSYKSSYRLFDKVVCISKAIKDDLIKNCNYKFPYNLEVIYNPHDIENIERMGKELLDDEKEEALFNNNKVILFLGRMSVQKAPWHLVKSFILLLDKSPETKLVMIGDGNRNVTDHLDKLIKQHSLQEKVVFLGRKSNPYKYLKRAKILALTSYYEGTPNVIVEAIACDTPVVASNCTDGVSELMSISEYEEKDRLIRTESGYITPNFFKGALDIPNDDLFTEEEVYFSKALQYILQDESFKVNLSRNKKKLLSKFNLENVCNQYIQYLRYSTKQISKK